MGDLPFSLPHGSVGIILGRNGRHIGSGFVASLPDCPGCVVTCRHLFNQEPDLSAASAFYKPVTEPGTASLRRHNVTVKQRLSNTDLAILNADTAIGYRPIPLGRFTSVRLRDRIHYVGFESGTDALTIRCGEVVTIGKAWLRRENVIVDALDIESDIFEPPGPIDVLAAHGFSGGPVFNEKGEAVAVLAGSWKKKSLTGCCYRLVNRAVSVGPLTGALAPN